VSGRSRPPTVRLWLAVLLGYLALGATLQELPGYLVHRFHTGPFAVGTVVGIAFAGTAFARPFAGRAGDLGWSRATAIAGAALTAAAAAGHLLAPNLDVLIPARLVMGVGEAALFSGSLPWVLSTVGPGRAGRVAGWFGLSMWGGLSAGPLLAVAARWIRGSTGVWSLVVALPIVSVAVLMTAGSPPSRSAHRRRLGWRGLMPEGVGHPGGLLGLAAYGYGTLAALLVLLLSTGGLGGHDLGLAVFAGAFLVTRAGGSPLVDRHGGQRVARGVLLIEAAGLACLAGSPSAPLALLSAGIVGVGLGLIYPATSKLILDRVPAPVAGAAIGAMTSFWDLGILAAGPLGGLIATHAGIRTAFWVSAAVVLSSSAISTTTTH
jgi:MFS family permease